VEVTEDYFEDGSRLNLEFENPTSEFYGLTAIQCQGEIIFWLQRDYGEHVQVEYTLYKDYLVARNQGRHIYPKYIAHLSDLCLLTRGIKTIAHEDTWHLPENPEFLYGCLIRTRGTSQYFTILGDHYECRWRSIL